MAVSLKSNQRKALNTTHFKKIALVGMGSFGPVWKVQREQDRKFYAMKMMKKSEIIRLNCIDTVMNEMYLLSTMQHP